MNEVQKLTTIVKRLQTENCRLESRLLEMQLWLLEGWINSVRQQQNVWAMLLNLCSPDAPQMTLTPDVIRGMLANLGEEEASLLEVACKQADGFDHELKVNLGDDNRVNLMTRKKDLQKTDAQAS